MGGGTCHSSGKRVLPATKTHRIRVVVNQHIPIVQVCHEPVYRKRWDQTDEQQACACTTRARAHLHRSYSPWLRWVNLYTFNTVSPLQELALQG
eukprot:1159157-Pelagomonas_calceolata.AAC.1